ncbi:MAG TPA: hypothetical protein VHE61_22540 [Opitutaceae bacterium]|nr:hypothetical protein [Opitutaceae bacterium]
MSLREQFDAKNAGLPPPCVETDTQTQTIVVYPSADESWVFPWARFGCASLRSQELKMTFGDREIIVRGKNLERVFQHVREFHVEILRTIDEHFRPLLKESEPAVTSIEVRTVKV